MSPERLISIVTLLQVPLAIAVPWIAAFPPPAASHTHSSRPAHIMRAESTMPVCHAQTAGAAPAS